MADNVHNAAGDRPGDEHNAASVNQNIMLSCTSEYKEYKYNEKHDIWSLVTIKAPCQVEDEEDEKRPPIDLVAVIDKSGSMAGEKLKLVKKTLEFVLTQLKEKDRLSVVTYDAAVYLDFGLKEMNAANKTFAQEKITNITDGSTTNLCGGLMKGLCQMIDRKKRNEVASVLLFTDGLANNGITNSAGIVAAMKDPKRFDGPSKNTRSQQQAQQQQAPHQGWLSSIFGGSARKANRTEEPDEVEPPKKDSGSADTADATVYTFGFGSDHNPEMLKEISDAGNGMYYYIENEDKIAESFAHCLGGLMSTVAQGIQLQVDLADGVSIKEVHTVKPYEKLSDSSAKINIGDLQSEEKRDVVLELVLEAVPQPYSSTPQKVLSARVDYFNVITNNLGSAEAELTVLRPETTEEHVEANSDGVVHVQKARVKMTKAMKKATKSAEEGNFEEARSELMNEISSMRNAPAPMDALMGDEYGAMADDLQNVCDNLGSATAYRSKGAKLQMNMMQQYQVQRSSNLDSKAFASKGKMKKQAAAKSFMKKK